MLWLGQKCLHNLYFRVSQNFSCKSFILQDYEGGEERSAFSTCSCIKLNDTILHLKQINRSLALVCIQQVQQNNDQCLDQGILDYNFLQLKQGIHEVLKIANL